MPYIAISLVVVVFCFYAWTVEKRIEHIRVMLKLHDEKLFPKGSLE